MGLVPVGEHRCARRSARAQRRDHHPPAGHEPSEHGRESRRTGEAAFDNELTRRFEAAQHMGGHQRGIEGRERGARLWRGWRFTLDNAFPLRKWAALV